MANHHGSEVIPIGLPTEILDPYPERSRLAPGVRQPADVVSVDLDIATSSFTPATPSVFAASLERYRLGCGLVPWASLLLALFGYLILGAVALASLASPLVVLAVWGAWSFASVLLVAAECSSFIRRGSVEV